MRCCPECFDDRGLRENIIPTLKPVRGTCDFCGSMDADLVHPRQLSDVFELLVSAYEPDPKGKSLVELMKEDWLLFSHPRMDISHAQELLGEILGDRDIVHKLFLPSANFRSEGLARWETLRDELMYKNRYIPNEELEPEWVGGLLDQVKANDLQRKWYRARILVQDKPYKIGEMGAPTKRHATHGRASPAGIPYLYLGSLPETAIAEVRPHTGELACVADFAVSIPLVAADLRNPRKLVSPFILGDPEAISQLRADIPFLERLGDELMRPVPPSAAPIDYVPSQYICELIKKRGYKGVVYRSSVSRGINLALFDPTMATGGSVALYEISEVSVTVKSVSPT
jgi:hypothetical protein